MEYDNILTQIGEFGHFQRRVFFVVCLIKIFHVFKVLGYVFWAVRLEHWCHVDRPEQFKNISDELWKNWTIPSKIDPTGQLQYESCFQYSYADNITLLSQYLNEHDTDVVRMEQGNWTHRDEESAAISQCKSWDYDTHQYVSSIVSKFTLVCERQWLISLTQSVYLGCKMFSGVGIGLLADRYGRRPLLSLCLLCEFVTSFALAFAPNVETFIVLRGLCATFNNGSSQLMYVMVFELVGPTWRVFASEGMMLGWAFGYMIMPLMAYFIRDHFILMLSFSLPGLPVVFLLWWVTPESPRWLLVKNKQPKALSLFKQMARVNRKHHFREEGFDVILMAERKENVVKEKSGAILRSVYFWKITVIQCFVWFTVVSVYYGLSVNSSNLGGNDYLDVFLSGVVEVPACILSYAAYDNFGPQKPLALLTSLAGCSLFVISFIPSGLNTAITILVTMGKFAVTCPFGMIYIYTQELYPTSIRSFGLGICNTAGRIGSAMAPFAADLAVFYPGAPFIIFGIMALVTSLFVFILPETRGISLPQTLDDCRNLVHQSGVISSGLSPSKDGLKGI